MRAFSLVELSIVLVILGLLTGGILAGQSLIRAAELRAVTAEYQRYTAAFNTFRDKYMALPGDMRNATSFWGKDNTNCSTHTGNAGTPGTCNGDGNGWVTHTIGATSESHQLWKQLALAGIIEGSYTGLGGDASQTLDMIGINAPASKLTNAGWGVHTWGAGIFAGSAGWTFSGEYGNMLSFGVAPSAGNWAAHPILKPQEAWNIDTKLDDGMPGAGKLLPVDITNCTTTVSVTDIAASYKLNSNAIGCGLLFRKAL